MKIFPHTLEPANAMPPPMGLIVLQADQTIEPEFRRVFSDHPAPLHVSRIPSSAEVTHSTLAAMEDDLTAAASLLPDAAPYPVVGYGCTSASSVIGSDRIETLVQKGCNAKVVTNPLRAALACAADLGISRLALLSPYIEEVNEPLRQAFAKGGLSTEVFGSFGESEEAKVVRISLSSVITAAQKLGEDPKVEGVFISCTNLRTLDAIPKVQDLIGKPVLSSNQSLGWHMKKLAAEHSHNHL